MTDASNHCDFRDFSKASRAEPCIQRLKQENLNDRSRAQGHRGRRLFPKLLRIAPREAVKGAIKARNPCCSARQTKTEAASTNEADYCEVWWEFKFMIQFQSPPVQLAYLAGLPRAHTATPKPAVAAPAVAAQALMQLLLRLQKRRAKAARAARMKAACPGVVDQRGNATTLLPSTIGASWDAALIRAQGGKPPVSQSQSATASSWDQALRKAARR